MVQGLKRTTFVVTALALTLGCGGCESGGGRGDVGVNIDAGPDMGANVEDQGRAADVAVPDDGGTFEDVGNDAGPDLGAYEPTPVPEPPDETATDESRARGFKLYYAERVNRLLTAYNRFHLTGDVTFGTTIRSIKIARQGDDWEVIAGPSDNNQIGTTVWNVYNAYRVFGTRELELTLVRMLNGLTFYEAATGHPGMTSREVYPGWTRVVDGAAGSSALTRFGAPVTPPTQYSPGLRQELAQTFWSGTTFTYRENPEEFMFSFFPAWDPGKYAKSISFYKLPKLIMSSECCSSLVRVPDDKPWAGAYWGNHNSRDNFPDIGLGFLAAKLAAEDTSLSADVRAAAAQAVEAGKRVGDLVLENDTAIITVSDVGDYDTFEVSGTIRPHGEPEIQDLGSMGACPMAFLAQAMSSEGLEGAPAEGIPLPYSIDKELFSNRAIQNALTCPIPDEPRCVNYDDGYCSRTWGEFGSIRWQGTPFLEYLEENQAIAKVVLSSWQNDYDDVVEATMAVYHYAAATGDAARIEEARRAVFHATELQLKFAELAYPDEEDAARRDGYRFRAALYRAEANLPVDEAFFFDFARPEQDSAGLERLLTLPDSGPAPLMTEAEIAAKIQENLDRTTLDHVIDRYETTYPDGPPIRRTADGYEASGTPLTELPWTEVEVPRHHDVGWYRFLDAVVLCEQAPQWVSCDWAKIGCEPVDVDGTGTVNEADVVAIEQAVTNSAGRTCDAQNAWCDGADLDRSGTADGSDVAFAQAAEGCFY